jgi:hypothetical protein
MDCLLRDVLPELERRMAADFPERLNKWKIENEVIQIKEDAWKAATKKAVMDGNSLPPRPEPSSPPPEAPRLRQNDVTVEKVGSLLATAAPKGLLIVRDELPGFIKGMENYNDAGRAFWLEAYGGRPYRVERKGLLEPIVVPRLSVSVIGGIQPERLQEMFKDADDGLFARFSFAWPEPRPFRLGYAVPNTGFAIEALDKLRKLELQPGTQDKPASPISVPLEGEAVPVIDAFGREMQTAQQSATGLLGSDYGKARGLALRVSLNIEYLRWAASPGETAPPEKISKSALEDACRLVREYYIPMSERVYGDAALKNEERNASRLANLILKNRMAELHVTKFIRKESRSSPQKTALAIHGAAHILVEMGWLREPPKGNQHGQARQIYSVNPALLNRSLH